MVVCYNRHRKQYRAHTLCRYHTAVYICKSFPPSLGPQVHCAIHCSDTQKDGTYAVNTISTIHPLSQELAMGPRNLHGKIKGTTDHGGKNASKLRTCVKTNASNVLILLPKCVWIYEDLLFSLLQYSKYIRKNCLRIVKES